MTIHTTDLAAKMAVLDPAFRLLAEATGRPASPELAALYTEHFVREGLMPEAVNEAVRDIVLEWEHGYWPSAAYIALKARARQRRVMGELHGVLDREREMEALDRAKVDETWQERRSQAKAWFEANPVRGREVMADIQRDMANLLRAMPTGRFATNQAYRKAFEQGAIVGAVLHEARRPKAIPVPVWQRMAEQEDSQEAAA